MGGLGYFGGVGATKVLDREALSADLAALDAAFGRVAEYDCEALTTPEQLAMLEFWERLRRRIPAVEHPLINSVARQATPEEPPSILAATGACTDCEAKSRWEITAQTTR